MKSSMNPNIIQYPNNFDSASNKGRIDKNVDANLHVDGINVKSAVRKLSNGPKAAGMALLGFKRDAKSGTSEFLPAAEARNSYRMAGMAGKNPLSQLVSGVGGFLKGIAMYPGNLINKGYEGVKDTATIAQIAIGDLTDANWVQKS